MEASEVVGQANQRPFARHLLFAAQTEPAKAHRGLDDPEDRFDGVVTPSKGKKGSGDKSCNLILSPPYILLA